MKKRQIKGKKWEIQLFDEGRTFKPEIVTVPYPCNDVEAALYGMRQISSSQADGKGFSLNVSFTAKRLAK